MTDHFRVLNLLDFPSDEDTSESGDTMTSKPIVNCKKSSEHWLAC